MTPQEALSSHDELQWLKFWPDPILLLDSDNRVSWVSSQALKVLQLTEDRIQGQNVHDLLCSRARSHLHSPEGCPLCNRDQTAAVNSAFWVAGDGHNINVDYRELVLAGRACALRAITFSDNRERVHNQEELQKFVEYVDANPAPMAEFDVSGQLLFANPAMHDLMLCLGFDDAGNVRVFPPELSGICAACSARPSSGSQIEIQIGEFWFGWHFQAIQIHPDAQTTIMGYAFDITRQKQAEKASIREQAEARRDFYAKMVHELRTPLNAIVGFSQVLIRRNQQVLSERDLDKLVAIRAAGLQLNEMVTDTLDISKIEAGKMELQMLNFDISELVESFREQLAPLAEAKSIQYIVRCENNLTCYTDPKKVRQIIINLVSNAIKYTHVGRVELDITKSHSGKLGEVLSIKVADTGVGIPPQQVDELFVAYHRVNEALNRNIQGTGLGLALVAELVKLLGGDITVQSEQGRGSCFSVNLPIGFSLLETVSF